MVLVAALIPAGKPGLQPRIDAYNAKADYLVVQDGGSVRVWLNRGGNTGGCIHLRAAVATSLLLRAVEASSDRAPRD
ncbi:hypothetical protein ABZW18_12520 [Streptomyces sp. NPDC004647]|uniref:hypothetical protein n=1 Tax=Streptomyces sp. NPDC004647 TaxID=3154671 RepID=UPI0033A3419F